MDTKFALLAILSALLGLQAVIGARTPYAERYPDRAGKKGLWECAVGCGQEEGIVAVAGASVGVSAAVVAQAVTNLRSAGVQVNLSITALAL